jgi:hypothetical protein
VAHDELDMARRFQADLRALLTQYPTLTTAEGQARLNGYMSKQIDTEENVMPTKDHRSLGEDLVPLAVRIPVSIIPEIDAHVARMRRQHRYMRIGRSDALRDLIIRACDAIAAEEAASGVSAAVQAAPPLSKATVQQVTEKLAKAMDLSEVQEDNIARMHDLIEAIPERTSPMESEAAEDDQAAVSEERQPPVAPKPVKARRGGNRKTARV